MINTKCAECMFSAPAITDVDDFGCSKRIIQHIKDTKKITQDEAGFNIIENYACRFGFSKKIYEENKQELSLIDFDAKLLENSQIRYYLLLDCTPDSDLDKALQLIQNLSVPPKAVSFMFRSISHRPFNNYYHKYLTDNYTDISWKVHNFVEDTELEFAIDHILSTNAKSNQTSYFLVYNALDTDHLNNDILLIHDRVILHQNAMIAAVDKHHSLYRLAMSFENYKVAKNIGQNLINTLTQETNIWYY